MKSFIAKRLNSILVNLRYLRFKLLKYKENNKKICNTFDHNFKDIPLYIMRKVSLERYYFVLYDCALTSKMSKMVFKSFCDKTLQMSLEFPGIISLQIQVTTKDLESWIHYWTIPLKLSLQCTCVRFCIQFQTCLWSVVQWNLVINKEVGYNKTLL